MSYQTYGEFTLKQVPDISNPFLSLFLFLLAVQHTATQAKPGV